MLLNIFYTCNITTRLWNELQYFVSQYLYIPEITPQSALFRFFNIGNQQQNFLLINHLLLIFKHYLYISREHEAVCFPCEKLFFMKIKTIVQNISPYSSQKNEEFRRNWKVIWKYSEINVQWKLLLLFLFLSIKDSLLILISSIFLSGEKFPSSCYIMKLYFKLHYLNIINTDNCIT